LRTVYQHGAAPLADCRGLAAPVRALSPAHDVAGDQDEGG